MRPQAISDGFFGPAKGGVYSPSVQFTLYQMGTKLLEVVPQVGVGVGVCDGVG